MKKTMDMLSKQQEELAEMRKISENLVSRLVRKGLSDDSDKDMVFIDQARLAPYNKKRLKELGAVFIEDYADNNCEHSCVCTVVIVTEKTSLTCRTQGYKLMIKDLDNVMEELESCKVAFHNEHARVASQMARIA